MDRIQALLAEESADGLLVVASSSTDPDLASFVGPVHLGECAIVLPAGGDPSLAFMTDMERGEAARTGLDLLPPSRLLGADPSASAPTPAGRAHRIWRAALRECGLNAGRLAVAGSCPAGIGATAFGELSRDGFEIVDFSQPMRLARKVKSEFEHGEIGRVAEAVCRAMRRVAALLASAEIEGTGRLLLDSTPLTAGRLREAIRAEFSPCGIEEPEGNIVSAGADAGVPHTQGADDRELRAGESIVVDLYPRADYFADCTRTFCVGDPPTEVTAAYDLVRRALEESTERARPGVCAATLQTAVCDLFEAADWPTPRSAPGTVRGYVHGLGHGVGLELHEQPTFRGEGPATRLEVGDVFTLEPGLYDPEAGFGIRIEDLLRLAPEGPLSLTPLPYELDPKCW